MGENSLLKQATAAQSDVNSREDALKAYRRTRLKLLAWALSDEDGN